MLVLAGMELIVFTVVWTIFWICAGNSVDNTAMFSFPLSRTCTVKAFSTPHPAPPAWHVHMELGEEIAGTADPDSPKGNATPNDVFSIMQIHNVKEHFKSFKAKTTLDLENKTFNCPARVLTTSRPRNHQISQMDNRES